MPDWHDFSKKSSLVNRPICLHIMWNFAISWRKCVFKLRYSLSTCLTNFSLNPKDQCLHCQEQFPAAASQKQNFQHKLHTKYHWISQLFAIWLNSTAFQNSPKMWMPSTFCNFCKPSILVCFSKPLPDPWLLAFTYRLDLAEFAESSKLAKMLIETNFHHLQK